MERYYTSYTKKINNTTYYFVKKYRRYSELKDCPAILESYGMHTDFNKACRIAAIQDDTIKQRLFKEASPGLYYGQNISATPELSKRLRIENINDKTALVTRLTGIKKIISSKMPQWLLLSHS